VKILAIWTMLLLFTVRIAIWQQTQPHDKRRHPARSREGLVETEWRRKAEIGDPPLSHRRASEARVGGASSVPPACRADIVAKPNADLRVLLPNVAFKEHTFKLGYAVLSPAEEFDAIVKAEHAKWGKIVIESGMRADE
jgi:hypothetical protein